MEPRGLPNELTTTAGDKAEPSIDIGYGDVAHISYRDSYIINYTKSSDYTNFDSPVSVLMYNSSSTAYGNSLAAMDSEDKVFVVSYFRYSTTTYLLKQNYREGTEWTGSTTGTNVETSFSYAIYYPPVGTNSGIGTDHKILGESYTAWDIYYYTWNSDNELFETRTDTTNNGASSTDYYQVSLEKHKPVGVTNMGYAFYNSTDNILYFDTLTGMENGSALPDAPSLKF